MSDSSYNIEVKKTSANGYFTPDQARAYYGRYARTGITIHWWGGGETADKHDGIVNYFLSQGQAGNKSVNYVVSDNKITYMVAPKNVAWTSQSGNATTISIEHQPTLGAEGYKKSGWLVDQLEDMFGRLQLYPHSQWYSTACPGSIDINRIRAEADKWKRGEYDARPAPAPTPTPPPPAPVPVPQITLQIQDIPNKRVKLIRDANLWDLHFSKYADAKSVKTLKAGTEIEISATAKHPLGSTYYLSEYSFAKGIGNGINVKDCEDVVFSPVPVTPPPVPVPVPVLTKDEEQDKRLGAIEAFIEIIKKLLNIK